MRRREDGRKNAYHNIICIVEPASEIFARFDSKRRELKTDVVHITNGVDVVHVGTFLFIDNDTIIPLREIKRFSL